MKKIPSIIIMVIIIGVGLVKVIENTNYNDEMYIVSESEDEKVELVDGEKTNHEEIEPPVKRKEIKIFISGEVNEPNVVTLDSDSILLDAMDKVGGLKETADLNTINLAMKVEDGGHYIVPKKGESESQILNDKDKPSDNKLLNNKININTSTQEDLDTLPGIGEITAQKIIKYRDENGLFKSIEEIRNVNGIGEKKYEEIRELISI